MMMLCESPGRRQRSWLLWLSTVLLVLQGSAGVMSNLQWRQVAAPVGVGIRSAMTHVKNKKSPLLSPKPVHASTLEASNRRSSNGDGEEFFREAQAAYSNPLSQKKITSVKTRTKRIGDSTQESQSRVEQCAVSTQSQSEKDASSAASSSTTARGGSAAAAALSYRPLLFWENMVAGAVSRSIAQTVMHPANTMKTILQSSTDSTLANLIQPKNFYMLTRGAGANFLLSVPHGAVNFAVLEMVRNRMDGMVRNNPMLANNADKIGPSLDFLSSAISTICCSVVSTPQMMITDNIMAGNYPNLPKAIKGLATDRGIKGFYAGWWPGLAGKIPSYAITWTFFQQLKTAHYQLTKRQPKDMENAIMGCIASGTTVCLMIPMDTIKTRLVTQAMRPGVIPYKGITDCAVRILKEEGVGVFYRGLPPRLVSVVPMIGIQFGVYEFMKRVMVTRGEAVAPEKAAAGVEEYGRRQALEEAAMEVAADDEQPFPAPHFKRKYAFGTKKNGGKK